MSYFLLPNIILFDLLSASFYSHLAYTPLPRNTRQVAARKTPLQEVWQPPSNLSSPHQPHHAPSPAGFMWPAVDVKSPPAVIERQPAYGAAPNYEAISKHNRGARTHYRGISGVARILRFSSLTRFAVRVSSSRRRRCAWSR